ncbi:MAG: sterol desaturase family protein [Hyphomicrobiales bacterium]|nr:sterol desaturase family protein [Hyphomicrobiales bacterium]
MITPIVYAIPVFLMLILIEALVGWRAGAGIYRVQDAVTSLSLGILSQIVAVFDKFFVIGIYVIVWKYFRFMSLPATSILVWISALLMYDFCYYWNHRLGHEVNVLWAAHVVHHSSEDYNLSTALRQTASGFLISWIFYMPLALLGFPPRVFVIAGLVDLLYQFWVHTELVPHVAWLDRVLVMPSNHRVHHGRNDWCLDRNYGGIFMFWDVLFGTYTPERPDDPVIYGTLTPLASYDPLWGNLKVYADIWRRLRLHDRFLDRLGVLFARPGWQSQLEAAKSPAPPAKIPMNRYDPPARADIKLYGMASLAFSTLLLVQFLLRVPQLALASQIGFGGLITFRLWALSRLWTGQKSALVMEMLATIVPLGFTALGLWFVPAGAGARLVAALALAMAIIVLPRLRGALPTTGEEQ